MLKHPINDVLFIAASICVLSLALYSPGAEDRPAPAYPSVELAGRTAYRVDRVVDGDTVRVLIDGESVPVRLIGVDTPETVHPRKEVEHYGKEASAFTRNLLAGESVFLVPDQGAALKKDKYGRLLAHAYRAPDGLWVNVEIVRQGYGSAYTTYPFKHIELFRAYERRARDAGKGLWARPRQEAQP